MISARALTGSLASLIAMGLVGGVAHADPSEVDVVVPVAPRPLVSTGSAWYDFGLERSKFVSDGTLDGAGSRTFVANTVRFGIGLRVSRHIYLGGDADFGRINDADGGVAPIGARSTVSEPVSTGTLATSGNYAAAHAIVGAMTRAGSLIGAAELAAGYHLATADGTVEAGGGLEEGFALEGRGRLGFWLTPGITVGGVVGVDLLDHRDVSVGLSIGLHPGAYDHARR